MQPLLLTADPDEFGEPERFADADGLARRVHALRKGRALDFTQGSCADGRGTYRSVLVWLAARPDFGSGPRGPVYLACAAGEGVDTPADLIAALTRTRPPAQRAA